MSCIYNNMKFLIFFKVEKFANIDVIKLLPISMIFTLFSKKRNFAENLFYGI